MVRKKALLIRFIVFFFVIVVVGGGSLYIRASLIGVDSARTKARRLQSYLSSIQPSYQIDTTKYQTKVDAALLALSHPWSFLFLGQINATNRLLGQLEIDAKESYTNKYTSTQRSLIESKSKLDALLQGYTGQDIPALVTAQNYLATRSATIKQRSESTSLPLGDLIEITQEVDDHRLYLQSEIYAYRKDQLASQITTILNDIDGYIPFFENRGTESDLVTRLNKAKTTVLAMQKFEPDMETLETMNTQIKTDFYPLLADAQVKRDTITEKEQTEYRQKLAALARAQTGVPEAPVKVGKVIYISTSAQRLYAYEDGVSLFSYAVPVTTGNSGHQTVRGEFAILQKITNFTMKSPFPDEPYTLFVKYWMPFYSGYGLHDAPWRGTFGGQEYTWNGTHGCVNMRESEVARIFDWAPVGTKVVVQ
ncbi:MAG: L,D-transpeptidase [Candidatus Roizmanbacteria bacterium]